MRIHLFAASLLALSTTAQAGVIVGNNTLLDKNGLAKLETWSGGNQFTLTNIFTKDVKSSTIATYHKAVDGKGPTFTLMRASVDNGATWETIGGYNPFSWQSNIGYRASGDARDWTAFIFNLTDSVIWRQNSALQTFNGTEQGTYFGYGDLATHYSLNRGFSSGHSYGDGCYGKNGTKGKDCKKSIVDGSTFTTYDNMLIGALEVFTISEFVPPVGQVPEPGSLMLLGAGLLGLAAVRRKKIQSA